MSFSSFVIPGFQRIDNQNTDNRAVDVFSLSVIPGLTRDPVSFADLRETLALRGPGPYISPSRISMGYVITSAFLIDVQIKSSAYGGEADLQPLGRQLCGRGT
jgi:hypothetical protein